MRQRWEVVVFILAGHILNAMRGGCALGGIGMGGSGCTRRPCQTLGRST